MKFWALFLFFIIPYARGWWRHTIVYEILIQSFKDSNGDGFGDLNGLTQKLDHFVDLKINTIYVTPFFTSPLADLGYDISNYTEINPLYGTMEDFDHLIAEIKKRGLKLIGDLVINHSSNEHPWFKKSVDRIYPYADYYVWVDPKGFDSKGKPIPPNNWVSMFGGSAWTWNRKRKQFYLHLFHSKQPDLNLRNELVKNEVKKIIEFWFDKGISGLRLDAPAQYIEDKHLRDEPLSEPKIKQAFYWSDLAHIYTSNTPDTFTFIHEIRQFVDDYNKKHANEDERILVPELYGTVKEATAYYDQKNRNMTHFPFNNNLSRLHKVVPAKDFDNIISSWIRGLPTGAVPGWMAENHDIKRLDRLGEYYHDIITITMMTLPGIACIYYGQEIGMQNLIIRSDQLKGLTIPLPNNDKYVRDGFRIPMQWDDSLNAGFSSSSETWMPIHPNYWNVNVETQKTAIQSPYNLFKTLSKLRRSNTMKYGDFHSYVLSKWVYAYTRSCKGCQLYVVILNLGTETELFDLHDTIPKIPSTLKLVTSSLNSGYKPGDLVRSAPKFPNVFVIRPSSAIVLTNGEIDNDTFDVD